MTFSRKALAACLILAAGAAMAKEGVQNPTVKARMDAMGIIAGAAKTLGNMAGGKEPFDAAAATAAKEAIVVASAQVPALFEPQETDPVTEAKPEIWSNWEAFVAKAEALNAAAEALDPSSAETVGAGMGAIGGACKSCHTDFRI